jgi:glycosyltransferase involved in cell wall biosynthesis
MACCRPVINEYCTGYPPEAKDCPAITFIPPGDAQALVDAVVPWIEKRAELEALRVEARTFFEKCLSMNVVRQQLADILKDLGF